MKFLCSAQRLVVAAPGLEGRRDGEKSKTENRKFAISAFETKRIQQKIRCAYWHAKGGRAPLCRFCENTQKKWMKLQKSLK